MLASEKNKLPHSEVGYVTRSKTAGESCGKCTMFVVGKGMAASCSLVRRPIFSHGWCDRFEAEDAKFAAGGRVGYADGGALPDAPWEAPVAPEAPWASKEPDMTELSKMSESLDPKVSQGRAAFEGVLSGASANFRDEVYGASHASGLPEWLGGIRAPIGAARLAYERFMGEPGDASKEYESAVEQIRAIQKRGKEQHPITSMVGEAAGAIALPGGAALQGATMPARMIRGAATGAVYGAASGAGEGENLAERGSQAATGAAFGAGAGVAAPWLLKGAEKGTELVKDVAGKAIAPFRGAVNPEQEAAKRLADAAIKHFDDKGMPLSADQIKVLTEIGSPQAIIDLLGERGYAIARSAANVSPEAREILKNFIEPRFEAQSSRAVEMARSLVPTHADAAATREALAAAAPQRSPFYRKAFKDGENGIWDDELYNIANSTAMKPIMRDAAMSMETKMVAGRSGVPLSQNGTPTLEFWDQVKRTLDSKINVAKRQGDKETVGDLSAIRTKIVQRMDDATTDAVTGVSSYATARGVAAELFKASDALEAGEKFFASKMRNADFRKVAAKMHDEEKALFAEGYASALVRKLDEAGDRRSILNHIRSSPAERERMEMALGKPAAQKFQTYLQVENIMDRARGAMGNSTTARQMVEMGLAGGASGYLAGGDLTSIVTGALLGSAGRKGVNIAARHVSTQAQRNLAEETARMLVSNDPAVIRKGIERLSRNPRMMKSLQSFDERLARIAAQHPPSFGQGRTEEQQ